MKECNFLPVKERKQNMCGILKYSILWSDAWCSFISECITLFLPILLIQIHVFSLFAKAFCVQRTWLELTDSQSCGTVKGQKCMLWFGCGFLSVHWRFTSWKCPSVMVWEAVKGLRSCSFWQMVSSLAILPSDESQVVLREPLSNSTQVVC